MTPKKNILYSYDNKSQFVPDDIRKEENQRRVFNEEAELIILKAIPEFMSKTRMTLYSTDFHTFVENLIPRKVTVEQPKRKIRGFKTKYGKGRKIFTKTHEKKAFRLFMNIDWATNGGSKPGSKSAKKRSKLVKDSKRAEMMRNLKLYIDRVKFVKDQAILMVNELD
jgi:hypothetical protein